MIVSLWYTVKKEPVCFNQRLMLEIRGKGVLPMIGQELLQQNEKIRNPTQTRTPFFSSEFGRALLYSSKLKSFVS